MDGYRMAGGSEKGVCGVRPGKRLLFSLGVHATVFQAEIFVISACAKECIGRAYTGQSIYICSDSQAALWALEASRVTLKFVWECQQALCVLSSWNKVVLLSVPGHCGIQGNEEADALAREGSSSPFLGPEAAILILPCVGRLKVKEWLKETHSKQWATVPSMRQLKLFIGKPSNKLSRDLMAMDKKHCKLVTGLLTGHCTLRQCLHVMGFSESTNCRKCGREEESSYHILC
jgi:hypothetical protein